MWNYNNFKTKYREQFTKRINCTEKQFPPLFNKLCTIGMTLSFSFDNNIIELRILNTVKTRIFIIHYITHNKSIYCTYKERETH